jgi:hypothetical protein
MGEPILTRVGTNNPFVKGIQICANEGQPSSPRGDNSKRVKIKLKFKKKYSPEASSQYQSKKKVRFLKSSGLQKSMSSLGYLNHSFQITDT